MTEHTLILPMEDCELLTQTRLNDVSHSAATESAVKFIAGLIVLALLIGVIACATLAIVVFTRLYF